MKKGLFYFALAILLCYSGTFAQTLKNGNFENWTKKVLYENPNGFFTSNMQLSMMAHAPNVTKTTDKQSGTYAIKLQTTATVEGDTIPGLIMTGNPGGGGFMGGGIPYSQRPTSLDGYAKYNIKTGDTAAILLIFLFQGNIIGFGGTSFSGITTNYTQFSAPITFFVPVVMPDTAVIIISSSSLDGYKGPGSTILFDHLTFTGSTLAFPNGDFENWTEMSFDEPDGWLTSNAYLTDPSNPSVSKSTEAQNGSFAAKIVNSIIISGDTLSFLTNGQIGDDGPEGGMPVFNNPDKVKFYYKYIPVGPDTALFLAKLSKFDSSLGVSNSVEEIVEKLSPTSNYTYFETTFKFNQTPSADTLLLAFAAGNVMDETKYKGLGSALFIDNISITYQSSNLEEFLFGSSLNVYPNPTTDYLNIEMKDLFYGHAQISICDLGGKKLLVKNMNIPDNGLIETIDLNHFMPGYYLIEIQTEKYHNIQKFEVR